MPSISIASICRSLPNPDDSSSGVFVHRRLNAMAQHSDLAAIQPIPYFPGVSPLPEWGRTAGRDQAGLRIRHAPMFYVPKFLKSLDGMWLGRAVRRQLAELKQGDRKSVV